MATSGKSWTYGAVEDSARMQLGVESVFKLPPALALDIISKCVATQAKPLIEANNPHYFQTDATLTFVNGGYELNNVQFVTTSLISLTPYIHHIDSFQRKVTSTITPTASDVTVNPTPDTVVIANSVTNGLSITKNYSGYTIKLYPSPSGSSTDVTVLYSTYDSATGNTTLQCSAFDFPATLLSCQLVGSQNNYIRIVDEQTALHLCSLYNLKLYDLWCAWLGDTIKVYAGNLVTINTVTDKAILGFYRNPIIVSAARTTYVDLPDIAIEGLIQEVIQRFAEQVGMANGKS